MNRLLFLGILAILLSSLVIAGPGPADNPPAIGSEAEQDMNVSGIFDGDQSNNNDNENSDNQNTTEQINQNINQGTTPGEEVFDQTNPEIINNDSAIVAPQEPANNGFPGDFFDMQMFYNQEFQITQPANPTPVAEPVVKNPNIVDSQILEQYKAATEQKIDGLENSVTQKINNIQNSITSSQDSTGQEIQKLQTNYSKIGTVLVLTFVNFGLLFVILVGSVAFMIKDKTPFNSENKSNPQSTNDQELKNKLTEYLRQNLEMYPYDSIKMSLIQQGFSAEEVDSVYSELVQNAA